MVAEDEVTLPHGVVTALVTPVTVAGVVDDPALDRLVERSVTAGVVALSPCGSTGEGARLTPAQRLHVVARVIAAAGQRPVVPGVPVTSVAAAVEELAELGRLGARAALVAPPSYYPATEAELVDLYTTLADGSPVPLLLYHIPMFTQGLSSAVVGRLMGHPRIVGLKDSSRDVEYLQGVVTAAAERSGESFAVYTGADTLLVPSLLLGARGAIAASPNLVPELGVAIVDAVNAGDLDAAWATQRALTRVVQACRTGSFPSGWKSALAAAGLCQPALVAPGRVLDDDASRQLAATLDDLGVIHGRPEPPR